MATPALAAARRHWPDAHVTLAGPAHAGPLLAGAGLHDELVVLPARRAAGWSGLHAAARRLAAGHHDLGLLLTNSFSSALIMALARVPRRVGYAAGGRSPFLTQALTRGRESGFHHRPAPMVEDYFRIVEAVGAPRGDPHYRLGTTDEEERVALAWMEAVGLDPGGPLFGIHPGSSFGPSKLWYPERFAEVADAMVERRGGQVVVFCGPDEAGLARSIAAAARAPVVTAADVTLDLGSLKAVIRRLDLLVSTDTGPRHIGPAFDVPTVVVMGSTDPRFTNTNLGTSIVVRSEVACSPCQLKVCPIDHRCMTRLGPDQVLAAAGRLLGDT